MKKIKRIALLVVAVLVLLVLHPASRLCWT